MALPSNPVNAVVHRKKRNYEPILIEAFDENESITAATLAEKAPILLVCFWILGLLNNASYVIMLACAKSISEGGTGLVFLANIIPSLSVKATAPYWFHNVSYTTRLYSATLLMTASFLLVAMSSYSPNHSAFKLSIQLLGVAFGSAQCGLGEASLLALAGKTDATSGIENTTTTTTNSTTTSTTSTASSSSSPKGQCLTSFSSGTGMAGVFGFFWKWWWSDLLGFSLSTTLFLALGLAIGYWKTFQYAMAHQGNNSSTNTSLSFDDADDYNNNNNNNNSNEKQISRQLAQASTRTISNVTDVVSEMMAPPETLALNAGTTISSGTAAATTTSPDEIVDSFRIPSNNDIDIVMEISDMTSQQRFHLVLSLWPYMVPLFVVYAAEYALQSGTWSAMGFPLTNVVARDRFYEFSNWMYQAGVFFSRSSGTLFTAPIWLLWLMPTLQTVNLVVFCWIAASPATSTTSSVLYRPGILYAGAFYTGLLGGAVYISGYKRICADLPLAHREFALSATSVAEGLGVVVADAIGLVIQGCLYQINGLEGALMSCPFGSN